MIADLEAGVGTLGRMPENGVDVLIVATEPTLKSIDVAKKVLEAAKRHPETAVVVAANKVGEPSDRALVEEHIPGRAIVIPADPVVTVADRTGMAPLDSDPDSPAVVAIAGLADLLESRLTTGAAV